MILTTKVEFNRGAIPLTLWNNNLFNGGATPQTLWNNIMFNSNMFNRGAISQALRNNSLNMDNRGATSAGPQRRAERSPSYPV